MSAEVQQWVPVRVGCIHQSLGSARVEKSCQEASQLCGSGEAGQLHHHCCVGTSGTPHGPRIGVVGSLQVELTFLAHVSEATWQHADVEMRKLV